MLKIIARGDRVTTCRDKHFDGIDVAVDIVLSRVVTDKRRLAATDMSGA